jgi:Domain of unknown function (DUF5664)
LARNEGPEDYLNKCDCEQINGIHNIHCIRFKNEFERNQMNKPPRGDIAKRVDRNIRYDILDPTFLEYMAKVADYGAKEYGDFNWHKSRLTGDKSPVNHMYKHLGSYQRTEPYDHPELGEGPEWHLIGIAFNAMMEFFYVTSAKVPKGS